MENEIIEVDKKEEEVLIYGIVYLGICDALFLFAERKFERIEIK